MKYIDLFNCCFGNFPNKYIIILFTKQFPLDNFTTWRYYCPYKKYFRFSRENDARFVFCCMWLIFMCYCIYSDIHHDVSVMVKETLSLSKHHVFLSMFLCWVFGSTMYYYVLCWVSRSISITLCFILSLFKHQILLSMLLWDLLSSCFMVFIFPNGILSVGISVSYNCWFIYIVFYLIVSRTCAPQYYGL